MADGLSLRFLEVEAAGHHEQDIRLEPLQIRPFHTVRRPTRGAGQELATRCGDQFRHPMARHVRRIEPLEREDAWPRPISDSFANGCDAFAHVGNQASSALSGTGGSADSFDAVEDCGQIMCVQRYDL